MKSSKRIVWLAAFLILALTVISCGSDEDEDTVIDDNNDGDSDVLDGDEDTNEDGDVTDGDETPDTAETFRGDITIPKNAGVVLTPGAYTEDDTEGDGSWIIAEDYLSENSLSNFGYTIYGLELGFGDLSKQVTIAWNQQPVMADNGALNYIGPFTSEETIELSEGFYYFLKMIDGETTYYLRLYFDRKSSSGFIGSYAFSTSPKFPN